MANDYEVKFQQQIDRLNQEQREAVETLEGPVLVFAGPGTGKTQVLTLRIANLIAQGLAEPKNILALTFTKAAAINMQTRLASMIGPVAYQVSSNTFHGFCQEVMASNGEFFPFKHDSEVVDELTQNEIMEKILLSLPLTALRPAGDKLFYLKTLLRKINTLKQENVTVDLYQELWKKAEQTTQILIEQELSKKRPAQGKITKWSKNLVKQSELLLIYKAYQNELKERNLYDYTDMILETIKAFKKNPDLLTDYQEQFQYLLVDEYQDTNNAQNEILKLLTSHWEETANIFVVGDAQQSIYRFQGANLENFLLFKKDYPQAKIITLKIGYRCTNKTYALAHHLMKTATVNQTEINQEIGLPLLQVSGKLLQNFKAEEGKPVVLTEYESADSEIIDLAKKIKVLQEKGVAWEKIAVLYRKNNEATRIMEIFSHYNIPVEIEGGINVLDQPLIIQLMSLWRLLINLEEREKADFYLGEVLWQPWFNLSLVETMAIGQQARSQRESLWQLISNGNEKLSAYKKLLEKILIWKQKSQSLGIRQLLPLIWEESGLLAWIEKQPNKIHLLIYLYTLEKALGFWEKQKGNKLTLSDFGQKIEAMLTHGLKMGVLDLEVQKGAISLATVHKAKGREWDYVFIYGLNEKSWQQKEKELLMLPEGILQVQKINEDEDAEARRLLFVALTRAKKQTEISWHKRENDNLGVTEKLPAVFVYNLKEKEADKLIVNKEPIIKGELINQELVNLMTPIAEPNYDQEARLYLKEKVKSLVLSASMLNTYLIDKKEFCKRYVLQMPSEPATPAIELGNSLHLALENFYKKRTEGGDFLPIEVVLEIFTNDLKAKNLPAIDQENYLKIGQETLLNYATMYQVADKEYKTLAVEKKFGYRYKLLVDNFVPIRGKIDRLDFLVEEENRLRVIDYKSGRSQTENELLGKTSSAKLSEREKTLPEALRNSTKRQLLFYKLLSQLEPNFNHQIAYGIIDFVKKTESNKPVRREFTLPDEEVIQLADLLKKVWQEILDLKFLENEEEITEKVEVDQVDN